MYKNANTWSQEWNLYFAKCCIVVYVLFVNVYIKEEKYPQPSHPNWKCLKSKKNKENGGGGGVGGQEPVPCSLQYE